MAKRLVMEYAGGDARGMVRIFWDADWEEYRVTVPGHPGETYHTESYSDAVATARAMAGAGWIDYCQAHDPAPGHD